MPRCLLSLPALLLLGSWSSSGHACGATETVLRGLLPHAGEADVPVNSVLWATGNHFEVELRLRRVAVPDADAGPTDVPVQTECLGKHANRLCLGRATLEANTAYEWQVVATEGGGEEGDWLSFTTGNDSGERPVPDIEVTVTRNEVLEFHGCGGEARVVELEFAARDLEQPLVVAGTMGHDYPYEWGWLLEPDLAEPIARYLPDDACETLVVYDRFGNETPLREVCFDAELPGVYVYEEGTRVPLASRDADGSDDEPGEPADDTPPADDEPPVEREGDAMEPEPTGKEDIDKNAVGSTSTSERGCAVSAPQPAGLASAGLVVGVLGAVRLRRRRQRR